MIDLGYATACGLKIACDGASTDHATGFGGHAGRSDARALGFGCDWRDVGFCIWEVSEHLKTPPEEVLQVFYDMVREGYAEASSLMEGSKDE